MRLDGLIPVSEQDEIGDVTLQIREAYWSSEPTAIAGSRGSLHERLESPCPAGGDDCTARPLAAGGRSLELLAHLFQNADVPRCLEEYDVDGDGRLHIGDALALARRELGMAD